MKIDYSLNIIGEQVTYSPRVEFIGPIINSDSRIFEITAGNGYGKTFMLNLISYACYSDKLNDDYILKSLRESIARFDNPDDYKLTYDLEFNLPDGKKLNLFKNASEKRVVQIDGDLLQNPSTIHNTIKVLYDVPVNPSDRLNAVIKDLGNWNNNLYFKLEKYWKYLRGLQLDFNNIRDDSKIKLFEDKINSLDQEIAKKSLAINEIETSLKNLNVYNALLELSKEQKNHMAIDENLSKSTKKLQTLHKPIMIEKKDEDEIQRLQIEKNKHIFEIKRIISELLNLVSNNHELAKLVQDETNLKQYLESIKSIEIEKLIISDEYVKELNSFSKNIENLTDEINFFIRSEEMGKKYIVYNFLKKLLEEIRTLKESNADDILEKILNTTSNTLQDEIQKSLNLNKIPDYSEVKSLLREKLPKTKSLISSVFRINGKLEKESAKKGVDSNGDLYYKTKAEIENYKLNKKDKENSIRRLRYQISTALNMDDSKLSFEKVYELTNIFRILLSKNNDLDNLPQVIRNKTNEKKLRHSEKEKLEESKRMNETILSIEKKKKDSIFSEKEKDNINKIIKSLSFVIKNLGSFNDLIRSINSGDLNSFKDKEDQEFINIAGKIIAYSMDNKVLRTDGNYIQLEYYDMLKKEFHCENNIVIKKDDISTGLASANYLRQRIDNVEGTYVIVLLDEIGNMAKDTLGEVIKSIKKLENKKKLVLALLTQPSSEGIMVNEF